MIKNEIDHLESGIHLDQYQKGVGGLDSVAQEDM